MGGGYLQPRVLLDLFPCFGLDSTLESEKKNITFHFPDSRCQRRFAASPLKKIHQHDRTPLHNSVDDNLVGGFNPFEKYYQNHQPVYNYWKQKFMVFSVPCSLPTHRIHGISPSHPRDSFQDIGFVSNLGSSMDQQGWSWISAVWRDLKWR